MVCACIGDSVSDALIVRLGILLVAQGMAVAVLLVVRGRATAKQQNVLLMKIKRNLDLLKSGCLCFWCRLVYV